MIYYLYVILSQIMVAFTIVGSKYLLHYFSPIFLLTTRFFMATAILLCIHAMVVLTRKDRQKQMPPQRLRELTAKDWFYLILQAFCGGIFFNLLLLSGLHYTNANVAGIVTSALPAIIVLLSVIFLRERLTLLNFLCILLAVLGLLVLNANNFVAFNLNNLWGSFILLLALTPEGGYYVLTKIHGNRLPLFLVSALMTGINVITLMVISLFNGHILQSHTPTLAWFVIIGLGLSTGLFYIFWYAGCQGVSGAMAGLLTASMPISTLIVAWIFLKEGITLWQFLGMCLIIGSILSNALVSALRKKPLQTP